MQDEKFEHQNFANTLENGRCQLQNVANTVDHGSFQLQNAANRNENVQKTNPKTEDNSFQNIFDIGWWFRGFENWCVCVCCPSWSVDRSWGHDVEVRTTAADEEYGEEEDMTEEDWDEEHAEGSSRALRKGEVSLVNGGSFTYCFTWLGMMAVWRTWWTHQCCFTMFYASRPGTEVDVLCIHHCEIEWHGWTNPDHAWE